SRVFPKPEPAAWRECDRLLPHAQLCASYIGRFELDFAEAGYLLLDAGDYLRRRARYAEAAELIELLLRTRERALGPDRTAVAQTLESLAKLYRSQGRYADAGPLLERALAIAETAHGPRSVAVARGLNTLAALRQNEGRLDLAEIAIRRALDILAEQAD